MAASSARGCCAPCCSRLRPRYRGGTPATIRSSPGSQSTPGMCSVSARRLASASSGNQPTKRGSGLPRGSGGVCRA
eukprot:33366-Alexandrium_andersonii.AAC.1